MKILWQDKAVNKKEFPEECAREREIMGQECIKWIEEVGENVAEDGLKNGIEKNLTLHLQRK